MIRLLNLEPAKHLCTQKTLYTEKPLTGSPYPCFSGYFTFVFVYIPGNPAILRVISQEKKKQHGRDIFL